MLDRLLYVGLMGVATLLGIELGSRLLTGKWAHEYLYSWWRELSEQISAWVHENSHLQIAQVIGAIHRRMDNIAAGAKRMFNLYAVDETGRKHTVTQEEIPAEELAQQFPELRSSRQVIVYQV